MLGKKSSIIAGCYFDPVLERVWGKEVRLDGVSYSLKLLFGYLLLAIFNTNFKDVSFLLFHPF